MAKLSADEAMEVLRGDDLIDIVWAVLEGSDIPTEFAYKLAESRLASLREDAAVDRHEANKEHEEDTNEYPV